MATFTIGNASWTNGGRKVTFTALNTRPAVFVGVFDNNGASAGYHIDVSTASSGWTSTNTFDDPTAFWTTFGTNQRLRTCNTANAATFVRYEQRRSNNSPWGDQQANRAVSDGATHVSLLLYTVGNNAGDWVVRVTPSSGGDQDIPLPITTDGWHEITLPLNSTITTTLAAAPIEIRKASGFFNVGDAVALSTAYIHNTATNGILHSDRISPNGTDWYTVQKVVNNDSTSGTLYVVYIQEPFTGATGTYSTRRQEAVVGQARDFTTTVSASATIPPLQTRLIKSITSVLGAASSTAADALSVLTAPNTVFSASITIGSAVLSTLTTTANRLFNSTINARSSSITALTRRAVPVIGQAVWTNGSQIVNGQIPTGQALDIRLFAGNNITQGNGGFTWINNSNASININDTWGVGATTSNGITTAVSYTLKRLPNVRNGAVAMTNHGADQWGPKPPLTGTPWGQDGSYCDGAVFLPATGAVPVPTNFTRLSVVYRISREGTFGINRFSDYCFTLSSSAASTLPDLFTNLTPFTGTPTLDTWNRFDTTLSNGTTFGKLTLMRQTSDWYNLGLLIDEVIAYHPTSRNVILPFQFISPDNGLTKYRVLKLLINSENKVQYVIDTPFVGVSGTYSVGRVDNDGTTHERPMITNIATQTAVQASTLTRLQEMFANVYNQTGVQSAIGKLINWTAPITSGSAITSATTFLKSLAGAIGSSSAAQGTTNLVKAFGSAIQSSSAVSALEYITFRFMTATTAASSAVQSNVGRIWNLASNIDAAATIDSFRTRLQFYTSTVTGPVQSVVVSYLGYAKLMSETAINTFSSLTSNKADVVRGISTQINETSGVSGTLYRSVDYISATLVGSGLGAVPSFIIGFSAPVDATSSHLPGNIALTQALNAIVAGSSAVNTTGEFLPVSLFSAIVDGSGNISAHFVRTVPIDGTLLATSSVTPTVGMVKGMAANTADFSSLTSRITVPDHIRKLIVESSGVVIAGDGSNVVFNEITKSYEVVVKGISIIQFDDLTNPQKQTIVVLE